MSQSFEYCLNSQTDISSLFEMIEQERPHSVIDIGMFLKRIGAITRQVLDREISADCILDGIDCMPDLKIPIYNVVYDHFISMNDFIANISSPEYLPFETKKYDFAAVMRPANIVPPSALPDVWKWVSVNCSFAFTNYHNDLYSLIPNIRKHQEFQSDEELYSLICFG